VQAPEPELLDGGKVLDLAVERRREKGSEVWDRARISSA
jgi:hypothetical protein